MNRSLFFMLLMLSVAACKNKVKDDDDTVFFPVLSYLQSQVRKVDTSLYAIVKISKAHGVPDTTYLRREDFKTAAQDFLSIPDLSSKKLKDDYTETKLFDEDLKKFVFTYEPKDKEAGKEITRQDVIIEPNAGNGDQVRTIYVETVQNNGDSTVQKRLTWNVDKSFQVIRLVTKKDSAETVETVDVSWTDHQ